MLLEVGKHQGQSLAAASDCGAPSSRLFRVMDKLSGFRLLVDTGAEVSIIPATATDRRIRLRTQSLQAVNTTSIATYGQKSVTLDLGLRRRFQWLFWIADVPYAILGADFLHHFQLAVDMAHNRLLDITTKLSVSGIFASTIPLSPTFLTSATNVFSELLNDFPLSSILLL